MAPPPAALLVPTRRSRPSREDAVLADVQELSRGPVRLFRNNVGSGWSGGDSRRKAVRVTAANLAEVRASIRPGDAVVPNARYVTFGLGAAGGRSCPGTSDLVGWVERKITADMAGQTVLVFASVEAKDLQGATPEQLRFIEQVRAAGGLAGVAHNIEEAAQILGISLSPGMVGARARFYQDSNCDRS
jgi:hypothetical protein